MDKPKVCILTSHPPFDTRIFQKEARTLIKAGYRVVLIAPHHKEETVEGVKIVPVPKTRNRLQASMRGHKVLFLALRQSAQVYHFHDLDLLLVGVLLKCLTRQRVIYDVHENFPKAMLSKEKHWLPDFSRAPLERVVDFFEKSLSRAFDVVITAAEDIEETFKKHRVISIRNYPSLNLHPNGRRFEKDEYILVYNGSITRTRGIYEMVQSLGLVDPALKVTLKLSGRFHDERCERLVRNLPEFQKVEFLGWLPSFQDVLREISQSDIGLVCFHPDPNLDTSVERSRKLFEYMMLGLPVIVSNAKSWRELVEKHNCGLAVDPRSPGEIAKAIEVLLKNPTLRREMGENGRKAVLDIYNWEREGEKLLRVYRDLTRGS